MSKHAATAQELEFWRSLQGGDYALPEKMPHHALLARLRASIGARDPVLRDEILYDLARHWLELTPRFTADELRAHVAALLDLLRVPTPAPDSAGDESVLERSFAALHLSLHAARDLRAPFLDEVGWRGLFDGTLRYLAEENDVRGWTADSGWHHSVAHTADVLKFLGRSRHLQPADADRILAAIEAKLVTVLIVLAWGEDERLAAAIAALVVRDDFDSAALLAWIDREHGRRAAVWEKTPFDAARFVSARNARNVLVALHLALSTSTTPTPDVAVAREALLDSFRP